MSFWADIPVVLWWWLAWLVIGGSAWWWSRKIFSGWYDGGYMLSKALGLAAVTFVVWVGGLTRVLPFDWWGVALAVAGVGVAGWVVGRKGHKIKADWRLVAVQEGLFLAALLFWSWIKGHEPTINGLEKFMDYGFTQSILQGKYFPPADMWFAGKSINYYYFGHLMMAVATRLSGIPLGYTFNLMLATIFALCLTQSFSVARQLLSHLPRSWAVGGALLIAYIVTMGGNLHTIYAFTEGYAGKEDNPPPFWQLKWTLDAVGKNYWYPNATRFIPWTIHEFPSYSFVVSDVHGHVLDIPLVLLAIGLLVNMFAVESHPPDWKEYALFGWIGGLMFMTNALDGIIYLGLFTVIQLTKNFQFSIFNFQSINKLINFQFFKPIIIAGVVFGVTVMPFVLSFEPFVSGVAVNCPPVSLVDRRFGPVVFETVDKCQKSPVWMMLVLWGFFAFCGMWYFFEKHAWAKDAKFRLRAVFLIFSLLLVVFPEFFYFKDIYPLHFRSNTMFKLGYQAFILSGIASGYALVHEMRRRKNWWWLGGGILLLALVAIYPKLSVPAYFAGLKTYQGINGLGWMDQRYPDYARAVEWLKKENPPGSQPAILEANGDSYTDANLVSAFSGLPTLAGWTVHEWLWRGGYERISDRNEEVRYIYESPDTNGTRTLLENYKVKYVVVGTLERQKFPELVEEKLGRLGKKAFESGEVVIYEIT